MKISISLGPCLGIGLLSGGVHCIIEALPPPAAIGGGKSTEVSMKKKALLLVIVVPVVIAAILFIGSGFAKRTDVFLQDYSVSQDGASITMGVGLAGSMGFVRDYTMTQEADGQYIVFYSAFGALNSSIGAKDEYEVELNPSSTKIYIYRGDSGYKLVLQKNESTQAWERSK